jgi:hypothetical protein
MERYGRRGGGCLGGRGGQSGGHEHDGRVLIFGLHSGGTKTSVTTIYTYRAYQVSACIREVVPLASLCIELSQKSVILKWYATLTCSEANFAKPHPLEPHFLGHTSLGPYVGPLSMLHFRCLPSAGNKYFRLGRNMGKRLRGHGGREEGEEQKMAKKR